MEQWIALAEKSGLKGLDLLEFVDKCKAAEEAKQKQINDREDRAAERELRKLELEKGAKSEAEAIALKKLELEKQATHVAEENVMKKLELERRAAAEAEENVMKKLELERRAAAEAEENAMRKLELERKMKEEEHLHVLELQREKRGRALEEKSKSEEFVRMVSSRSASIIAQSSEEENEEDNEEEATFRRTINARKGPKLPPFEDGKDNMDAYLRRFEKYATIRKWENQEWAVYLSALLKGRALDVYARMPPEQYDNYEALKNALLKRYEMTEEGFRKRFHNSKPETGESPQQFITRLESYLMRWIELAKVTQDFDGLKALLVKEQYLAVVSRELALFLRERVPKDLQELGKLAETYLEAHDGKLKASYQPYYGEKNGKSKENFQKPEGKTENAKHVKNQNPNWSTERLCYICNKGGHSYRTCKFRMNASQKAAGLQTSWKGRNRPIRQNNQKSKVEGDEKQTSSEVNKKSLTTTATSTDPENTEGKAKCEGNACQALKNLSDGEEVELRCGCKAHVVAEVCKAGVNGTEMKTTIGYVEDQKVEVLRDTGCSSVVVARRMVKQNQCILIDKTIRKVPTAIIDVRTEYFTGKVKALCMKETLYDLVIGNIPGAELRPKYSDKSTEVHEYDLFTNVGKGPNNSVAQINVATAVETRGMKKKAKALPKPLRVPEFQNENITLEALKKEQAKDSSLKKYWEFSAQKEVPVTNNVDRVVRFVVERGLLYRRFQSPTYNFGDEMKQLIVPSSLRTKVMELAHSSILGGHLGIHKTQERFFHNSFGRVVTATSQDTVGRAIYVSERCQKGEFRK